MHNLETKRDMYELFCEINHFGSFLISSERFRDSLCYLKTPLYHPGLQRRWRRRHQQ